MRQQQNHIELLSDLAYCHRIICRFAQGSVTALLPCQYVKCVSTHSVIHHYVTDALIYTIIYNAYTIYITYHHDIQCLRIMYLYTLLYTTAYSIYPYVCMPCFNTISLHMIY